MTSVAVSPGKLILSGEHAVVHGAPALVLAVDRYTKVTARAVKEPLLTLRLTDRPPVSVPLDTLANRLSETLKRWEATRAGTLPIRKVCPEPEDLLLAACARAETKSGRDIQVENDIPLGAGLGSSAARLLALFRSLRPDWSEEILFQQALSCEHLQHGASSGIDVAASLHGGLLWSENGEFTTLKTNALPDFTVFDTGRPGSTTGECVARVGETFPISHAIWRNFAEVTRRFRNAIRESDADAWRSAIRDNHRLLSRVGVVPEPVQSAIRDIEADGGAAKLCGAGSVHGDRAGMLLLSSPTPVRLPSHWKRLDLSISSRGTTFRRDTDIPLRGSRPRQLGISMPQAHMRHEENDKSRRGETPGGISG